ncbi:MAG TPA: hypothetical protein VK327_16340, partial [Candidatus Paceibacterota bacterium]|nr:hypothetical protein [Candidatus Paceibacterota bacterium]
MWFIGQKQPELFRVEFHCGNPREFSYLQQQATEKDHRFTFREFAQALSLLFLEYRCAGLEGREVSFVFPGNRTSSTAASLSHALNREGKIHTLFTNYPLSGGEEPYATVVLGELEPGDERQIFVKSDILASDCVEIYWNDIRQTEPDELRRLNTAIREACGLEPSRQPPPPKPPTQVKERKQPELLKEPEPPKAPEAKPSEPNLSGLLSRAVRALEKIATKPPDKPSPEKPQPKASQPAR